MVETEATELTQEALPEPSSAPPSQALVDEIIRNRVYASAAVGLVPIPLVDLGVLTTIQVELIYRLGKLYGVPFNQQWIRKAVSFVLGSLTPVLFAPSFCGLLRYVPVVGQSLGAVGGSISFGAATYVVGCAFAKRFANGEAIEAKDFQSLGDEVKSGFTKAKDKVKGWFSSNPVSSEPEPEPAD
ncbi:MAG: DUF697 domain-containing protein [Deltaproteobacteria bacterium]|jgi:uncharacterized protein (DUF697 family)|nr:DUF697 domain-containing protein [Deltaproteobacteria bacterium]